MQTITIVLILLLTVTASNFLAQMAPFKLPLPLLQIVVGFAVSYATDFDIVLNPDIFFLLFIPPLLFLDGWRIPKGALLRDHRPILMLAIGLVIFTVVCIGLLIDWLIPMMPLAVSFALAAILSPTDPVAVSAITAKTPIPRRLMHILEGESLLNDASGLVCFRFAVAAALTGTFSIAQVSLQFALVAGGGVLIGALLTMLIGLVNQLLIRQAGEEPGIQVILSLLIPFAAYLAAEHLHASGILAAATAGITMHYADLLGRPLAATRMQRSAVWDTVQMILNGIMFVLLGQQLPRILNSVAKISRDAHIASPWHLAGYVVCITLALTVLRLAWVWASVNLTLFNKHQSSQLPPTSTVRLLGVTAFAGVKGAITLAGILTLPLALPDGTPFPARDLTIFLAMGVILLSLLLASVALPMFAAGMEFSPRPAAIAKEVDVRNAAAEAAIRCIEKIRRDAAKDKTPEAKVIPEAAMRLIELYQHRLHYGQAFSNEAQHALMLADTERHIRIEALRAERDELYRLRMAGEIDDPLHLQLVHEIDLMEAAFSRQAPH